MDGASQVAAQLWRLNEQEYVVAPASTVTRHPKNARRGDVDFIEQSMMDNGFFGAILVQKSTRYILAGNHTWESAIEASGNADVEIPMIVIDVDDDRAERILSVSNAANDRATYDSKQLIANLQDMLQRTGSLAGTGYTVPNLDKLIADTAMDNAAGTARSDKARITLAERFIVPPFSVLDARQGYWQVRKRAWIDLGITGETGGRGGDNSAGITSAHGRTAGRAFNQDIIKGDKGPTGKQRNFVAGVLMKSDSGNDPLYYEKKKAVEAELGRELTTEEFQERYYQGPDSYAAGTSIFDPVLCELAYRWFAPPAGSILDPCAGECTKGIVASYLGYDYTGVELRQEQVDANHEAAGAIRDLKMPTWLQGDSVAIGKVLPARKKYDLVFTSPPYYDLEVYSDHESDSSAMQTYDDFMVWYRKVFRQCVDRLRDNRFVVVKVGEIRDPATGAYRNFVGDNIAVFRELGLAYYNEAVLVTPLGSVPIRAGKQFSNGRKLGKTHQNVLVFFKGDTKVIKDIFPHEIEHAEFPA